MKCIALCANNMENNFFTKYFITFYLVSCVEWLLGWRLERSFQESILSFRNVDPGNEDEDVRLGGKYLYIWIFKNNT